MQSLQGTTINIIKQGLKDPKYPDVARHAEVEINGRLTVGDVIFTDTIIDYYKKRYHLDSRLNRCILHIAKRDTFTFLRVRTQSLKPIPTVIIENCDHTF